MKSHMKLLESLDACQEAREWAEKYPSMKAAWMACERSDWMLWLCGRLPALDVTSQEWRLLACDFAEDALQYIPTQYEEVRDVSEGVIEVARRFALGDATDEERAAAANAAANAAYAAANAAYAAYAKKKMQIKIINYGISLLQKQDGEKGGTK